MNKIRRIIQYFRNVDLEVQKIYICMVICCVISITDIVTPKSWSPVFLFFAILVLFIQITYFIQYVIRLRKEGKERRL